MSEDAAREPFSALMKLLPLLGPPGPPTPGVVYRHFDPDDALLYVGSTDRIQMRDRHLGHARDARWWRFVARVEQEEVADRRTAFAAERVVIAAERPIFNRYASRYSAEQDAREQRYLSEHAHVPDRWPGSKTRRPGVGRMQRIAENNAMLEGLGIFAQWRQRSDPTPVEMHPVFDLGEYMQRLALASPEGVSA